MFKSIQQETKKTKQKHFKTNKQLVFSMFSS